MSQGATTAKARRRIAVGEQSYYRIWWPEADMNVCKEPLAGQNMVDVLVYSMFPRARSRSPCLELVPGVIADEIKAKAEASFQVAGKVAGWIPPRLQVRQQASFLRSVDTVPRRRMTPPA